VNAHGVIGWEAQILSEMARAGIEVPPPDIVADGKIHRFASRVGSKKPNGWYVVHPDRVIATWAFGDWSLDISESGQGAR
jgi:hypothetical protein